MISRMPINERRCKDDAELGFRALKLKVLAISIMMTNKLCFTRHATTLYTSLGVPDQTYEVNRDSWHTRKANLAMIEYCIPCCKHYEDWSALPSMPTLFRAYCCDAPFSL